MGYLDGRVALVTGGGRGLGHGISLELARAGAKVAVVDLFRDEEGVSAAEATVEEIRGLGSDGIALGSDVSSPEGVQEMVDAAVEAFGRLDILVTCAGNTVRGAVQDLEVAQWDSVLNLHLKGTFLACRAAVPHMLKQNHGRIITVASRGAFHSLPLNKQQPKSDRKPPSTAYAAAKAGILGMTATLAAELWDTDITVNSLLPSAATQLFPETGIRILGDVPPTRSLDPDDIAPAVAFFASDAAKDISGRTFYASGGDVILFGPALDTAGSRMIRKDGRWTQTELEELLLPLAGVHPTGA